MMKEALSFLVMGQDLAVDIDYVEMVIEIAKITPVPQSKVYIKGVVNLRGRIVPVIDLTDVLEFESSDEHTYDGILILKIDGEELGILVDRVSNVITFDDTKLELPASRTQRYSEFTKGIIKIGNKLIIYLDIAGLIRELESEKV